MLETRAISFNANLVSAHIAYRADAPSAYTATNRSAPGTPFAIYGAWKINERYAIGLGVYTPFGSTIRYDNDWKGEYLLRELSLRTIYIQPTFGMRITDKLSVGFAPVFAVGSVSLRRAIPLQDSTLQPGEASLESKGSGIGFNSGIYFRPSEALSLGLAVHSGVGFNAKEGAASFLVPASLDSLFPDTKFTSKIRIPWVLALGAGWQPTHGLLLAADVNFTAWSSYDTLAFDFEDNTTKLTDSKSARNYKNSLTFRLGAQWQFSQNIIARAGAYFDLTPVQDGFLTPESPDANRLGLTAGTTFLVGRRLAVDACFVWVEGMKRSGGNTEAGFSGTWKSRGIIGGFGIDYYFSLPSNNLFNRGDRFY
jgi:long-chain fatty acid transport protein